MTSPQSINSPLLKRIGQAVALAKAYATIERVWPRLVLATSIAGLFLIVSWLGLWPYLPDVLRFALVGVLGFAFMAAVVWSFRAPASSQSEAIKRVERASGLTGRPLATLVDQPFDTQTADGAALWAANQERLSESVGRLSAGTPAPRTDRLDPWALRAPVLLLLVVAFFVAGPERLERIEQALAPMQSGHTVPIRVDVWATPPGYTGLPPRTLMAAATLDETTEPPVGAMVPTGSRLTVLLSDPETVTAALMPMDGGEAIQLSASEGDTASLETIMTVGATLELATRSNRVSIPVLVTPDIPPLIRFEGEPEATVVGALKITYFAEDDYAVETAHAEVTPADEQYANATPLIDPPRIDLVLPQDRSGGTVETTRDLSAHPWAGLEVDMTLVATDGAGQEATSRTQLITLPTRPFREELALALVEQRRLLAIDTRTRMRVLTALEGFAIAPEQFMADDYTTFLALTVTTQRLRFAETDEDLLDVIDLLWQLALQVEDGDLSLAAERLREAEENLAEALENGASEDEIIRLMDELRQAFQEYMQALAERMQSADMADMPQNMPMQNLDPLAMQDLMDQIQDLAELGAADAARELLEQLREQLDQLRGAQAMQQRQPSPAEQQLRESIQELQDITREQQRLLDETFPFTWDAQRSEARPPSTFSPPRRENRQTDRNQEAQEGEQPSDEPPFDELAQDQGDLEERLQALMDELRDLGLDPSEFGEAADAMDGAATMLDRSSPNNAINEQGRALEALRQGAQDMMEQLAQGQGQGGQGEGQAQGPGQNPGPGQGLPRMIFGPSSDGARGVDPLGRPQRDQGQQVEGTVRIPEESDIQRARDILDEIQRRLGDRLRRQDERDYLDRLIERF